MTVDLGLDGRASLAAMRFNMGCGRRRMEGCVNVDAAPECEPDEVFDLETTPWPWPTGCAEEIFFIHALEHMGADAKVFLAIMQETYRIAAPGCRIVIHVPHPRHDNFLGDPTHVRPITPQTLSLFDRQLNDRAAALGHASTPLALYTGVDFKTVAVEMVLDEPYATQLKTGELSQAEVERMAATLNNVVSEFRVVLEARKALGAS